MRILGYRQQRTLAADAVVEGCGFLGGAKVQVTFRPAPENTGVLFVRSDLPGKPTIPARIEQVTGTQRRTTLGHAPLQVTLVEHVLAALGGLRIDNCIIEINGGEPPGLDGSALQFARELARTGQVAQSAPRAIATVEESIQVQGHGGTLAFHPAEDDELKISYILDFAQHAWIGRQMHTEVVTPTNFLEHIAPCRTFLLEEEALGMQAQGFGKHLTRADLLVFGPEGPLGNPLRFANEPARHKILDIVGDFSLSGVDLRGHIVAYRSGHGHNAELVGLLARTGMTARAA